MTDRRAKEHETKPTEFEPPNEWAMRELPARAATFLHVIGSNAPIRAAMQRGGYEQRDHDEGLRLLVASCALHSGGVDPNDDVAPRAAAAELQRWAITHVPRLEAALARYHPKVQSPLGGLDFADTAQAVLSMATFLGRLDELDSRSDAAGKPESPELRTVGPLDEGSSDENRNPGSRPVASIIQTLQQRAFGLRERRQLAELVRVAQHAQLTHIPETNTVGKPQLSAEERALLELHRWYADWKTTAKSLIRRRDWLLSLGLRKRRTARDD